MLTTTLKRIRAHGPCGDGWRKLLTGLGKTSADDEPLPYAEILRINGLDDAIWCCRAEPQHAREWRLFAVWCARQVQHLMTDEQSIAEIDVAERHANGDATDRELYAADAAARDAAWNAARNAAWATADDAAWNAAWNAAWATADASARAAAWATADAAARYAAWASADAAARAAAWATAWNAAWNAAEDAAEDAQSKKFLEIVGG